MTKLYEITEWVLRLVFPDRWVNKDTAGAVLGILTVTAVIVTVLALSGCYGGRVYAEYEHHSSVPLVNDVNTTDQAGGCVDYFLGRQRYAPNMGVCLHWELDRDKPVFGDDPVGTVRIQQPLYMWGRR